MQATESANHRIKALTVRATEIKQASDHCSGHSETWSEVNLDAFARIIVEECIGQIEQKSPVGQQGSANAEALKMALLAHFGL